VFLAVSLEFVVVLLGFGVFDFSALSQEIGWEERLRNDLFCVKLDVKVSK